MNIIEAKTKIEFVKDKLLEMQKVSSFIEDGMFEDDPETGRPFLEAGIDMNDAYPKENEAMHSHWEEIKRNAPPGFSFDSNLIRHLSFNEAHDWLDITKRDIPRELTKVDEYRKQLFLIEYLDSLHPEVSRVTEIVLSGDLDAALKTIFATLDSKIRVHIGAKPTEATVSMIGKAFKEGKLIAPQEENNDSARNFLQGVIGYYRNILLHNPLPTSRNRLDASLSLFTLAHEAFKLFDSCSKPRDPFLDD